MTALLADVPFSVGGLLKATFIGAASAAVTFGIGTAASSIFSTPAMGFWQGAYQGAIIGGITGIGGLVTNAKPVKQLKRKISRTNDNLSVLKSLLMIF